MMVPLVVVSAAGAAVVVVVVVGAAVVEVGAGSCSVSLHPAAESSSAVNKTATRSMAVSLLISSRHYRRSLMLG